MKESEAKTKWCPFARQQLFIAAQDPRLAKPNPIALGSANRFVEEEGDSPDSFRGTLCVGSGCMLWVVKSDHGDPATTRGDCGLKSDLYLKGVF